MRSIFTFRLSRVVGFVLFDFIVLLSLVVWNSFIVELMLSYHMNDFGKFYYSTVAFLNDEDMYGPSPATLIQVSETEWKHLWNLNPPHFHIFILPLAFLSPVWAFAVWSMGSLLSLFASCRLIIREVSLQFSPGQWRLITLGFLCFAGTAGTLMTGQLSWLLLLPVTLAWLAARHKRWIIAGLYIGLLISVKSFFLIFIPYLAIRRQFRAIGAAGAIVIVFFVAGLIVFGLDPYRGWLNALSVSSSWAWMPMCTSVLGILSRGLSKGANHSPILSPPELVQPLWFIIVGSIGIITLLAVSQRSVKKADIDREFSLLLVGSQLISPLGWIYYLWLPLGPMVTRIAAWWSEPPSIAVTTEPRATLWRKLLLLATIPGLVWPLPTVAAFQIHPWAAVSIGSIYFWSTFLWWAALLADWRAGGGTFPRACAAIVGKPQGVTTEASKTEKYRASG